MTWRSFNASRTTGRPPFLLSLAFWQRSTQSVWRIHRGDKTSPPGVAVVRPLYERMTNMVAWTGTSSLSSAVSVMLSKTWSTLSGCSK
uniref:Putative secreted protein n=1 Tax=Ixodes ricinus TaxID=34613 RepID=A0A6B0UA25_IXORI